MDRRLNLTRDAARLINDPRDPGRIRHDLKTLLRQRVYGIAQGYEDVNDQDFLRKDPAFQTAVNSEQVSGSSSTLCRFEKYADRQTITEMHSLLWDRFIDSFDEPPEMITLDFDATDDPVHGNQEGKHFNGYYDHYCFLPLYAFCKGQLLVSYLREAHRDGATHTWAILALLVKRIRKTWPEVKILFRGDSGFCRHKMLNWCEKHDVDYIIGLTGNIALWRLGIETLDEAYEKFMETGEPQKKYCSFLYAAGSWKQKRQVIMKAEHGELRDNSRFIVTSLEGDIKELYEDVYCLRGDMENRIKEQMHFFSDRTSCTLWWANNFRLMLSSLAYVLVETLRRECLKGTSLARSYCSTIRLKLLKIGVVILRNTRRIRFLLNSNCPYQELFAEVCRKLCPG
jgi:hypothetical protein